MGAVVRLYFGWRLLRLIRPLLVAGLVAAALLAVRAGHAATSHSGARALQGGAAAVRGDLPSAFEHAFKASSR